MSLTMLTSLKSKIFQESTKSESQEIILQGRNLTWLNEGHPHIGDGSSLRSSLDSISKVLQSVSFESLGERQYAALLNNLNWMNGKIQEHNRSIQESFFMSAIDKVLNFVTRGRCHLTFDTLDHQVEAVREGHEAYLADKQRGGELLSSFAKNPQELLKDEEGVKKLESYFQRYDEVSSLHDLMIVWPHLPGTEEQKSWILSKFLPVDIVRIQAESQLTKEECYQFLLSLEDQTLLDLYAGHSFFEANGIGTQTSELSKEQMLLLERLTLRSHKETLLDLQTSHQLRDLLITALKESLTHSSSESMAHSVAHALVQLNRLDRFISADSLLKVMIYVNKNRDLFVAGTVGEKSRSRPSVMKVKAVESGLPYDLEYDPQKGDVAVKLGFLGKGQYKVVKKQLNLLSMQMQAVGKQQARASEQEEKMMEAAKGLPQVVQLHSVRSYYSRSKFEDRSEMKLPLYLGGELEKRMKGDALSSLSKLQIASDVARGVVGLHERGILHRDLKPANIFLDTEIENGHEATRAIVGDLGLACFTEHDLKREDNAGTPYYMPLEVLNGGLSDEMHDAWSLGITLSELFRGGSPVESASTFPELYQLIGELDDPKKYPEPEMKDSIDYVIWKLTRPKKDERMSVEEALPLIDSLLAAEKRRDTKVA